MQSETGFPSSHQLKSYVASKSRLKLAARAVLLADACLLVFPHQRLVNSNVSHPSGSSSTDGLDKTSDSINVFYIRENDTT